MRQTGKCSSDGKNRREQQGLGYTSVHFWVTSLVGRLLNCASTYGPQVLPRGRFPRHLKYTTYLSN